MGTENRRVAGYLPPDLDRKFKAFAKKSGGSESKALILILEAFFDRESEKSGDRLAALEVEIKTEIERIHRRIDNLEF